MKTKDGSMSLWSGKAPSSEMASPILLAAVDSQSSEAWAQWIFPMLLIRVHSAVIPWQPIGDKGARHRWWIQWILHGERGVNDFYERNCSHRSNIFSLLRFIPNYNPPIIGNTHSTLLLMHLNSDVHSLKPKYTDTDNARFVRRCELLYINQERASKRHIF